MQHQTAESDELTFVDVGRADDDQVGDEGGESRREAGLSDEAQLKLIQTDGLVIAAPVPT